MKKGFLIGLVSSFSLLMLTGCTISTPFGTLDCNFNSAAKSENVEYTDDMGNKQEINTKDLDKQIDGMLDSVALPEGSSTDDLKEFVHGTSEAIGIDKAIDGIQNQIDVINDEVASNSDSIEEDETSSENEALLSEENVDTETVEESTEDVENVSAQSDTTDDNMIVMILDEE